MAPLSQRAVRGKAGAALYYSRTLTERTAWRNRALHPLAPWEACTLELPMSTEIVNYS